MKEPIQTVRAYFDENAQKEWERPENTHLSAS